MSRKANRVIQYAVASFASIVAGGALFAAPEQVAAWSNEAAVAVWLVGPVGFGYLLGRWLPGALALLIASAGVVPLATTVLELLRLRSHIWPLAFVALAFWISLIYLGSKLARRGRSTASGQA